MDDIALAKIVAFLSNVSFFSEVEKASLTRLCKDLPIEEFDKNDTIIEKGGIGDAMYVILDGEVKVHDNHHVYGYFSKAECFGEYALIDEKPRSASVTAVKNSQLLKIDRNRFSDLMVNDKGFTQGVLSVLIKRHRELDTIQERLAASKEELEVANAKMSGLINGAMDAIIMFDNNFKILLANPSALTLLENEDVLKRNFLFFLDDSSAEKLESLLSTDTQKPLTGVNKYLPSAIKVIGSNGLETQNEGTLSTYESGENTFYTLILRNIEERLEAEDKISLLTTQTEYLEQELKALAPDHGILGEDKTMVKMLGAIEQVATTSATVLVTGETGTGKELVAHAIHRASSRSEEPLIKVNCGAIPANLIESELFGHEKGAFTGATANRKGRFLLADKGTIFLDEIGELPLELQPKLLRVLQEGEFDPVGSSQTVKVDVRIVAATHRDLLKLVKEGKFREDLFYRLNVFPISVPALRERGEDVCVLADAMITRFSESANKKAPLLNEVQKELFINYDWPGNVRELQNLVERAVIVSKNGKIDWSTIIPNSEAHENLTTKQIEKKILTSKELANLEKENILQALKKTKWKVSGENGAAALLQLPPTTLASRIKALGIVRPI